MKKKKSPARTLSGVGMLILSCWMAFSPTAWAVRNLPGTYRLGVGQTAEMELGAAVLSSQDEHLTAQGGTMQAQAAGETEVTLNLFGLFPIGRMRVDVEKDVVLMPGGGAVGVAMATKGVLVVGVSDVSGQSPAQSAGIRAGDMIEQVDGQDVATSEDLTRLIAASGGKALRIVFSRDGQMRAALLTPALDAASGRFRMGAWVRDSTAGVGTLSYYNPADGTYGALGHAINDGDTGKLLPIRDGALLEAQIVDVKKGQRGTPGELRGNFLKRQVILGNILENTTLGIYGVLDAPWINPLYPAGLPIGYQESVRTGPATILSTVDGEGIKEYSVEITQVTRQMSPAPKSMVIRVTDPELLEKTGGIVQGMSGSPIIQNGRVVGAVTHVFVDDPTHGYGLFIEWMLQTSAVIDQAA